MLEVQHVPTRGYAVFEKGKQISLTFYAREKAELRLTCIEAERALEARREAAVARDDSYFSSNAFKHTTTRPCITCAAPVESEGPGHRMCYPCRRNVTRGAYVSADGDA